MIHSFAYFSVYSAAVELKPDLSIMYYLAISASYGFSAFGFAISSINILIIKSAFKVGTQEFLIASAHISPVSVLMLDDRFLLQTGFLGT